MEKISCDLGENFSWKILLRNLGIAYSLDAFPFRRRRILGKKVEKIGKNYEKNRKIFGKIFSPHGVEVRKNFRLFFSIMRYIS
ncbi:MAG: hypothetical protein QXP36_07250 [Conexivisphaerales archaeon]